MQRRALDELARLPGDHPLQGDTWRRVLRWRTEAESATTPTEAERELIMNTERFVQQWEQRLLRKGRAEGKAEGMAEGMVEGKAEGMAEGMAEGKAEGLRVAVLDLCEAFGIELRPAERTRLKALALNELEALRQAIKQERRWPKGKAR